MIKPALAKQQSPPPSAWLRMWQGFTEPEQLFIGLREHWAWAPAYWLSTAGILVSAVVTMPESQAIMRLSLEKAELPPSAMEAAMFGQTVGNLVAPFLQPLFKDFIYAFVMMLAGGVLSVRVRFSKLFSIVAWSAVPASTIGTLLTAVLIRVTPIEGHQGVSLSPALFLQPRSYGTFLHTLLLSLDVFAIWTLCLLGYGFKTVHKVSTAKAVAVTGVVYLVTLIITAAVMQVSTAATPGL